MKHLLYITLLVSHVVFSQTEKTTTADFNLPNTVEALQLADYEYSFSSNQIDQKFVGEYLFENGNLVKSQRQYAALGAYSDEYVWNNGKLQTIVTQVFTPNGESRYKHTYTYRKKGNKEIVEFLMTNYESADKVERTEIERDAKGNIVSELVYKDDKRYSEKYITANKEVYKTYETSKYSYNKDYSHELENGRLIKRIAKSDNNGSAEYQTTTYRYNEQGDVIEQIIHKSTTNPSEMGRPYDPDKTKYLYKDGYWV